MPHIVILGTADTKIDELLYLRAAILNSATRDVKITLVDVGRRHIDNKAIDVPCDILAKEYAPADGARDPSELERGEVIRYMSSCASNWLRELWEKDPKSIHGIISAGGTGGTSLASTVMRDVLPIGFPKLIVSTAASGDTGPIVGEVDITLMYSVVDIAGANSLLKRILSNAAGAIVGMAHAYEQSLGGASDPDHSTEQARKRVGLTMFGVTTPCVDKVRQYLEANYHVECFVFHCTGHGGLAMERLVTEGKLDAVLDLTTTELCDLHTGGVMSAGPDRLEAPLKAGIPYVISVGATDMTNFGPKTTVPEKYQDRKLYEHNPTVTLMRTSVDEAKAVGEFIVDKVTRFAKDQSVVQVMLPLGGISMIATPDGPFADHKADEAMFEAIRKGLKESTVKLIEDNRAINDEGFAVAIAKRLGDML